ncbi:MAG: hypothetical protein A2Y80_00440 [Deltaproteobacteria bacterium RBG_13_58_19]|nr:MAG: hypothetical protein A2Y80_00440 [Deltaproteobacteria bacterium RBG_13_58_19]
MARRKAKVGPAQKLTGYVILAVLGLITIWLLVQQSRFNPAVVVATRTPPLQGRPQAVSGQPRSATTALLPEVSGFTPLAPSESFGPENLSDKINGKAELYLSAGFKEMSCRSFRSGEAHVEVYLYDMGAASNAYAVFSSQRRPGSANITLTSNAYATANGMFFTQGRFYVEIVADRAAADALRTSLETYAAALLAKMPSEGEPPGLAALLPREGLEPDSVRLSPADTFGLAGFNNVLTGEYSLRGGKTTAFVAERDTPEQAQADARRYLEFLAANGYQEIRVPGALGDTPVWSLEESFEMVFVQGRTLAGVHDASSLAAALELAAQVKTALRGKQ